MTVPFSVTVVVAGVAGTPTLKFRFAVFGFGVPEVGWNVTDTVQVLLPAVAGRIAGQDDAANPAPELAPVMLTPLIESGAPLLLVLAMMTGCAAVLTLSAELNVSEVCETLYVGTNRVPVRRTFCVVVPPPPLTVSVSVFGFGDAVVGSKVTLIVQVAPGASCGVQPEVVSANWLVPPWLAPVKPTLTVSGELPVLTRVTA